ncbi:MAG: dienelactone hydrolase family protein, partial [Mycobacterium sp.]
MPRTTDTVTTADGTCPVSIHTPTGAGPWPAIIMYPDAGGVRPTFRAMADTLAGYGYT